MGKSSAPPAPDYEAQAKATAAGNLEAAQYATAANRVNQHSDWGDVTYTRTGGGKVFDQLKYDQDLARYNAAFQETIDPETGQRNQFAPLNEKAPDPEAYWSETPETWDQYTTLSPELKAALQSQLNVQKDRSQIAEGMLGQIKDIYGKPLDAPALADYLKNNQALDQTKLNASDYTKNVPGLDYSQVDIKKWLDGSQGQITDLLNASDYTKGVKQLDQDAPVYDTARQQQYAKAAFDASNSFLSPQYEAKEQALRDQLALQGLNPMSAASGGATQSFYDSKNQAMNQLANQSLLTGSSLSNADYASQLAGFNSTNAARTQALQNALQTMGADVTSRGATNAARATDYGQRLAGYAGELQAQAQANATRNQGYQNGLNTMAQDLSAQQAANASRTQDFQNNMTRWGADYQSAVDNRNRPLNELNALLTQQQVSAPSFPGYAMQGQTGGADLLGAATNGYSAAVGANNADNANTAATTTGVASAAIMAIAI